jgi:hypothetical protein
MFAGFMFELGLGDRSLWSRLGLRLMVMVMVMVITAG